MLNDNPIQFFKRGSKLLKAHITTHIKKMSIKSEASSEVLDSTTETETVDIFDEQMFFILKQFLVSKSGANVAECLERVADELSKIRVALESRK